MYVCKENVLVPESADISAPYLRKHGERLEFRLVQASVRLASLMNYMSRSIRHPSGTLRPRPKQVRLHRDCLFVDLTPVR